MSRATDAYLLQAVEAVYTWRRMKRATQPPHIRCSTKPESSLCSNEAELILWCLISLKTWAHKNQGMCM